MTASPRTSPPAPTAKRLQFERLDGRQLMAAVIWENNTQPPGFSASVQGGALVFNGGPQRDKVIVHDIVANKSHKQLVTGKNYIEIQHQDTANRLRKGWLEQPKARTNPLNFVFHGKGGNDHFQYIDTTGDPAERRDRQITAYGGAGDDSLHGYNQNDVLIGDAGKDYLFGELGNDLLLGGEGNDRLWGDGVTNPHPTQNTDADYLEGGPGVDELYGWQGGDILNGGNYWKVSDEAIDKLYGYSEADCFYLERFLDPKRQEPNDISVVRGDMPDVFDVMPQPPSYDQWQGNFQAGQPARPFNLEAFPVDRAHIASSKGRAALPHLGTNYEVLAPLSTTYNCIAASVGTYSHPIRPEPPTLAWANHEYVTLRNFHGPVDYNSALGKALLADPNKEIVVVYALKGKITHAASQNIDGTWTSKLGDYAMIRHATPEAVGGSNYGDPVHVYSKNRVGCGCW